MKLAAKQGDLQDMQREAPSGTPSGDTMIRFIEERSINSLPALRTMFFDGWILRFAEGYTRRANSVNPLYPSALPLDDKIDYCEQLYRSHGLDVIFKLTDAALPADLDARLDGRGYQHTETVIVQTCTLGMIALPPARRDLILLPAVNDAWLDDYCRLNGTDPARKPTIQRMLGSLAPSATFAALVRRGVTVAVGVAVLDFGFLGLFDVVVEKSMRRQGYGSALVSGLLSWGKSRGASHAYLQVVDENLDAQRLYARLAFEERYRYWYRTRRLP